MKSDIKAGSSFVELLLKDSKFTKGLAAAGRKLKSFAKSAAVAGAALAAAAVAGVGASLKHFLALGDSLAKMSQRTGLSVESLSELKHAAEQSGTSLTTVEQAIRNMTKKGFDPAKFDEIAAGIAGIEDPAERARKAMEVFGSRSGTQLLPMLADLQALRQEARDLGFTMSSDTANASVKLGDSLANLWTTVKGLGLTVAEIFVPILQSTVDALQSFATNVLTEFRAMQDTIGASLSWIADMFKSAWGFAQTVVNSVVKVISFSIFNWKKIATLAILGVSLAVVRFANQTVHFFGTVIPGWLKWFGENWRDVFTSVLNFTKTIAGNIWLNLKNLWESIKGLFAGEGFEFEWTNLTKGYKSAIKELPKIAEREMGPLEADLQKQFDGIKSEIMADWENFSDGFDREFSKPKAPGFAERKPAVVAAAAAGAKKSQELRDKAEKASTAAGANDSSKEIFATFSAAALMAQGGMGGGVQNKQLEELRRGNKISEQLLKKFGGNWQDGRLLA